MFELGNSGLFIRGIVPIVRNNNLLGSLEFMQGVGSVSRDFEKEDKKYLMLLTPKALEIAKGAKNNKKVDNFVVLNDKYFSDSTLSFAKKINYKKLFKDKIYIGEEYFSTYSEIKNSQGDIIAYNIIGQPITFINQKIDNLNSLVYTFLGIMVLIVLVINIVVIIGMKRIVLEAIENLHIGLDSFFSYVNRESKTVEIIEIKSMDEIGEMITAINENIEKTKITFEKNSKVLENTTNVVNSVKNGILTQRINESTPDQELSSLKSLINDMLDELNKNIGSNVNNILNVLDSYSNNDYIPSIENPSGKIENSIIDLRGTLTLMLIDSKRLGMILLQNADELTQSVNTLYKSSNKEAATLEEIAAIITDIANNLSNTNSDSNEMLKLAKESNKYADLGQSLTKETSEAMDDINEKVNTIHEAISVIDQIAFQTNILSLNAAVEAATAGEAGKGFAVVAQEVRNLASRSAEAAKEIKDIVESATAKANDGKTITHKMAESFSVLKEKISKTTELVVNVTETSNNQLKVVSELDKDMNSIDTSSQKNAEVAQIANQIAIETKEIANSVVKKTDEQKFDGKEDIKVRSKVRDDNFSGNEKRRVMQKVKEIDDSKIKTNKKDSFIHHKKTKNHNSKKITEISNSNDEWESF